MYRSVGIVPALLLALPAFALTEIRTAAQIATEPKFVALEPGRNGAIGGLCVDIMRAIERIQPDLKFVGDQTWEPLVRVETGVANGTLDATCGFLRNSLRETKFNYIEPPLFPVHYYLVVRSDDDVHINSWDDVRKLGNQGIVLVINGFGMVKRMHDIGGLIIDAGATDSRTNLEKLLARRGRFYIHRSPGIEAEIKKAGLQGKVRLLPTIIHTETFHMVVSKTMRAQTVKKLQAAIRQLESTGELKRLLDKWDDY